MKILRNFSKIWRQTHVHIQPIYFWGCIPRCHDSYLVRIGSFKPAVQSVSQCMQAKHCFPVMAKPLAKKPENFICVLAAGKDYAFCKACHKLVKVTVSGWYDIVRCCQNDVYLRAVTKRMLHVLINLHTSCKHSFPMVLGQTLWSPMPNIMVRSFRCLTGL